MFSGYISFILTPHGYVIHDIFSTPYTGNRVCNVFGFLRIILIEGKFNFNPVRGQFCKRPHKLINWSKT